MSENPDAIRAEIEETRERLGTNVDALAHKVTPAHVVQRQTDKVKGSVKDAVAGVKDKVMGVADSATSAVGDTVSTVQHKVSSGTGHAGNALHSTGDSLHGAGQGVTAKLSDAGDAISAAPGQVKSKAQGNPMAAGLIAFGAGMLLSSLIPASTKERQAADQLKTAAQPLGTKLTDAAKDMVEDLKEPAQEAMESVKASAADAVQNVKAEGQGAVTDVKDRAADAKDTVQST
ncbi:DUF3618 domain-containing protein [Arthrobacter sp. KFRI-F3372]|uniref:DUF3618 domain-containing protein n=1 Tax=Micrococcaceae TaxID=1268 RepID=UPI0027853D26|nr:MULTISPECIES: DUF3618 domain-containing protein [Micrococcaceae]MDP9988991.1 gas vesicle protein [Arthrobacter oryzae]MEE2523892.1 DUF3618 domain-containing protein [Pseudarthrobacter sp. J47]MEE2530322.1 DUF3618 domain-containing protein [Pseudarthrobacter sp. J75]WHP61059.1 DUF3618 domain-containing protein [Arthrobacter sp. KFRI-F3372]